MAGKTKSVRLVKGSDDLWCLQLGRWAEEKVGYLRKYCDIFSKGMKNKWPRRVYIDLFCGPGRICIKDSQREIEGSPLAALQYEFTDYFFNDTDAAALDSLKKRIGQLQARPGVNYKYYDSDCNQAVARILPDLPSSALCFCFIDLFAWEIHFSAIEKLTRSRPVDLAITFHTGSMKRAAHLAPRELDLFFGDSGWKQQYERARYPGRVLLDFYKERLKSLGYEFVHEDLGFKNSRGVLLYHLLFASKHRMGGEFWDKISEKSPSGQLRMFREETGKKYSP